ncbi:uncharacterized protein PAC_08047 [Phialocephala subalpina]|uniref:Uncharacterized protein n=1 Tax=Phialocephala subalpina TaxID=576137 RepID=A0A1L7WZF0_9HELO|nr:uncharacterized protein PAC_08047 [Phialocephala subalpina]
MGRGSTVPQAPTPTPTYSSKSQSRDNPRTESHPRPEYNRTEPMESFTAMESGSTHEAESPLQWNHTLPYITDITRECEERQEPLSPTYPIRDAMLNQVLNESGTFPMPDLLGYFPEEFTCVTGLSSSDTCCYPNSYEEPNAHAVEVNCTESSDQNDLWFPELQVGTEIQPVSQTDFDLTSFEMTPRKLTQSPTPISSADVFDGSIPTWFENMVPSAELSPLYSTFSSQSSFSNEMNRSPSTSARRHSEYDPRPNILAQPIPSPERPASSSQILPASNNRFKVVMRDDIRRIWDNCNKAKNLPLKRDSGWWFGLDWENFFGTPLKRSENGPVSYLAKRARDERGRLVCQKFYESVLKTSDDSFQSLDRVASRLFDFSIDTEMSGTFVYERAYGILDRLPSAPPSLEKSYPEYFERYVLTVPQVPSNTDS